jgi:virulence factor Mce-like protein
VKPLVAVIAVALVGVLLARGSDAYVVRVDMPTAAGLREGADVKVGGATVGSVESLTLGRGDVVQAKLALDGTRIGAGAAVAVRASNLLGDKFLALQPGDAGAPAPSGATIPAARVSFPVDLDQVLDVLDPTTRARLGVLLDQAGVAVTGRRTDIGDTLAVLGPGLGRVDRLVGDLHSDNAALQRTLVTADRWVAAFARERAPLARMVDTVAGTASTVADRHEELRATLSRAPGTLRSAQGFLGDLQATTVPLGPAARAITATAPELGDTLDALPAFTRAARPALAAATRVAPALSRLATGATPVVRRAVPAVRAVRDLAQQLPPFTTGLANSVDGLMSLLHGWARAVQTRDAAGHVFRGDFIFGPALLQHALAQYGASPATRKHAKRPARPARPDEPAATVAPVPAGTPSPEPGPAEVLQPLLDRVDSTVGQTQSLLDFLLKP